jgi:hypothetical protein
MNDRMVSDDFADWDAAYVLGALSIEDRRDYEAHLSGCSSCRAAVTELAGLPGILAALSPEDAVATDPPADVLLRDAKHVAGAVQRLATAATRQNRRRRRLTVSLSAFAGAALLAAGLLVGVAIAQPSGEALPTAVAMTPVGTPVMTASIQIEPKSWGTKFDWNCAYTTPPTGAYPGGYELVVTDTSGHSSVVSTWKATGSKSADLSASTDIAASQIRSVSIRQQGSQTPLVSTTL